MTESMTIAQLRAQSKKRKFGNKRVYIDGYWFDSKRQAARYGELKRRWRAGEIHNLELEPSFVLAPSVKIDGEARKRPAARYRADFAYTEDRTGERIVEDVKSTSTAMTEAFRLRQHLMKSVHGIDVRIVK